MTLRGITGEFLSRTSDCGQKGHSTLEYLEILRRAILHSKDTKVASGKTLLVDDVYSHYAHVANCFTNAVEYFERAGEGDAVRVFERLRAKQMEIWNGLRGKPTTMLRTLTDETLEAVNSAIVAQKKHNRIEAGLSPLRGGWRM